VDLLLLKGFLAIESQGGYENRFLLASPTRSAQYGSSSTSCNIFREALLCAISMRINSTSVSGRIVLVRPNGLFWQASVGKAGVDGELVDLGEGWGHYRNPPPNTMIFYQSTVAFLATDNGNFTPTQTSPHWFATFLTPRETFDYPRRTGPIPDRDAAGGVLTYALYYNCTTLHLPTTADLAVISCDRKTFDLRYSVTTQIFTIFSLHLFRRRCDLQALIG
jgi:hypothetical protein